jgi:hypothetical protein
MTEEIETTFVKAVNATLARAMRADDRVFVLLGPTAKPAEAPRHRRAVAEPLTDRQCPRALAAALRAKHPADSQHEARLARAIGTEQGRHPAGRDLEGDAVHHRTTAASHAHIAQAERRPVWPLSL